MCSFKIVLIYLSDNAYILHRNVMAGLKVTGLRFFNTELPSIKCVQLASSHDVEETWMMQLPVEQVLLAPFCLWMNVFR